MSGQDEPLIMIVDENDNPIGAKPKKEIWEKGLRHRIARIMVEDESGNILLQKRADSLQLYPERWDDSAAGHVDEGEEYLQAAERELDEEIGLKNVELEELGSYKQEHTFEWRKMNRFNRVYRIVVDRDKTEFKVNPSEVSELKWLSVEEAKDLIKDPSQVTDGLKDVIEKFY